MAKKHTRWYWFRYECAVQGGSIHCHGIAKLESHPGLCDLSQTALKGYIANQLLKDNSLSLGLLVEGKKTLRKAKKHKLLSVTIFTAKNTAKSKRAVRQEHQTLVYIVHMGNGLCTGRKM